MLKLYYRKDANLSPAWGACEHDFMVQTPFLNH